jgi:hypothetical protein
MLQFIKPASLNRTWGQPQPPHPEYVKPCLPAPNFTRHFFRADDVRAALFTSICDQKREQVAYWTQELIDSGAPADIIFTLIFAYVINYSHTRLDYLTNLAEVAQHPTPESLQQAAYNLCILPLDERDGSFFLTALHVTRRLSKQEREIKISPTTLQILQRPAASWLGAQANAILDDYLQHLLWLATTYTNVDPSVAPCTWRPLPSSLQSSLNTWATQLGRRARRLPFMNSRHLYGMSCRGATWDTQTATEELNCAHETFHHSPYWSALCPPFPRDDETQVWEDFLNAVFMTDDIPDEWSAADKDMSHGPGAMYNTNKYPKVGKWMHMWVPAQSCAMSGWRSTIFDRYEFTELPYPITIYDWIATQIQDTLLQRAMREFNLGDDDENLMED